MALSKQASVDWLCSELDDVLTILINNAWIRHQNEVVCYDNFEIITGDHGDILDSTVK